MAHLLMTAQEHCSIFLPNPHPMNLIDIVKKNRFDDQFFAATQGRNDIRREKIIASYLQILEAIKEECETELKLLEEPVRRRIEIGKHREAEKLKTGEWHGRHSVLSDILSKLDSEIEVIKKL